MTILLSNIDNVLRPIPTSFSAPTLDGEYFLVTGTGRYSKNVQYDPAANLNLIRLTDGGQTAALLWGCSDGGKCHASSKCFQNRKIIFRRIPLPYRLACGNMPK